MKKVKCYLIALLILNTAFVSNAFAQVADANTKRAIAGKTYQVWSSGKFDDFVDAASGGKMVFDANSNGVLRQIYAFQNTDGVQGQQQIITVTYTTINSRPAVTFKNAAGGDAGSAYITSYDNGTKVWAESTMASRPMKGWMLQIPPAPIK